MGDRSNYVTVIIVEVHKKMYILYYIIFIS